jgi:hypothetical protein
MTNPTSQRLSDSPLRGELLAIAVGVAISFLADADISWRSAALSLVRHHCVDTVKVPGALPYPAL